MTRWCRPRPSAPTRRPRPSAEGYAEGETDEFIPPRVIGDYAGMKDGDGFFCLNFRADRAREILRALGGPEFAEFDLGKRPALAMLGMVDYSEDHTAT
jgi:2,3-bisphosphoglycerate-independent phosphoglycerate mutase